MHTYIVVNLADVNSAQVYSLGGLEAALRSGEIVLEPGLLDRVLARLEIWPDSFQLGSYLFLRRRVR